MSGGKKHYQRSFTEDKAIEALEERAAFEDFKDKILPSLRAALAKGTPAKDIYKQFASLAAARAISIAALEVDSGKALAAVKDILDRAEGKAAEKITHTHHYENLTDDELDAQIVSRAEEAITSKSDPDKLN